MEVILLERIAKLGQMGDVVRVREGYARNFLLPQKKALRATNVNRQRFEKDRGQLEARNLERRQEAEGVGGKLNGKSFIIVRQAGETGQLYGSVTTRDLAEAITADGFSLSRNQVALNQPIKEIGLHKVEIALHPEVSVTVTVNVARSADEAERQSRGEDLTLREQPEAIETYSEDREEEVRERFFEPAAQAEDGAEAAKE